MRHSAENNRRSHSRRYRYTHTHTHTHTHSHTHTHTHTHTHACTHTYSHYSYTALPDRNLAQATSFYTLLFSPLRTFSNMNTHTVSVMLMFSMTCIQESIHDRLLAERTLH